MLLRKFTVMFFLLFSGSIFAQGADLTIGINGGLLISAFEDQDKSYNAVPLGLFIGMHAAENVELGLELSHTVSNFELEGDDVSVEFSQTLIGGFGRFYFYNESNIVPFLRAGLAVYLGEGKISNGSASFTRDTKPAFGLNIGAGFGTDSGFYGEFIFHIVEREYDVEGAETFGANNWGVKLGYAFSIN